jgi:hypothetical protein
MAATVREHVKARHAGISPVPRDTAQVARVHARAHHRLWCDHFHEEDGAGALVGPGSGRRRPSGWATGLGVVERMR